jgi:hypothetical protein
MGDMMSDKNEMLVKVDEIVKSKKPLRKEVGKLFDEFRAQVTEEVVKGWKRR